LSDLSSRALVSAVRGQPDYQNPDAVLQGVRDALARLHLPPDFIRPGDRVVLKPNWVKEHDERRPGPDAWEHVVTHPAVIEATLRWVAPQPPRPRVDRHLRRPPNRLVVRDPPSVLPARHRDPAACRCDFPGLTLDLMDLRPEEWHAVDGVTISKTILPGDPLGSTQVALDAASEFVGFSGCGRLYGASYDMAETNSRHHAGTRHDYLLCRTPMEADVFINLPKLKTHKKVGLTCALKNLVGINANKNWLPHHTEGTPSQGGDQFPADTTKARLEHSWMGTAKRLLKNSPLLSRLLRPPQKGRAPDLRRHPKVVRSGNWHGNDTCWRMVLDLNKASSFDGSGRPRSTPRRYLAIVDGIIGGEGNGPMAPDPEPLRCSPRRHPSARRRLRRRRPHGLRLEQDPHAHGGFNMRAPHFADFNPKDLRVSSNHQPWNRPLAEVHETFTFRPHFGWVGAIERPPRKRHDISGMTA
jgi:uncharacterized protein (DUF362 family)